MLRFLAFAFVPALFLAACGGAPIALDASHPLGQLAEIDEVLRGKGFEKSRRTFTGPECFHFEGLGGLTVWQYEEHPTSSMGVSHWVLVGVDDAGRVMAIGGKFASQSDLFSDSGTKTQVFLATLWKEIAGAEPTFTVRNRDTTDVDEYLNASLRSGSVEGYWEKIPNSQIASHTRSIWDMLLLVRHG